MEAPVPGPAWLVHAVIGFEVEPGTDRGVVEGLLVLDASVPPSLTPRLEVDGKAVATTWGVRSPGARRRFPQAANSGRSRFRSASVPARSCMVELIVEDAATGGRTSLALRHVVTPGRPGSRAVERVLDQVERARRQDVRDEATYRRLRRSLRRIPPADRHPEWHEARVLLEALFRKNAKATHRRLRALRQARQATDGDAEFSAFWTRLTRVTHPHVLGPHGYQLPLAARDHAEVWRETARLTERLHALGHPTFVSYGTLLGLVREGGLIAHDDDVDLTVLLDGETPGDVVRSWQALKEKLARLGLLRLDFNDASRAHAKLQAKDGLSVDLFPSWRAGDRFFAWPLTYGGLAVTDLLPLQEREVCGTMVRLPRRPETHLETMYGPDWGSPDPSFRFDWAAARDRFAPFLEELHRTDSRGGRS